MHRSTPSSQAVEFSHLLNIGPTLPCPGQGWGNQSLRHWSQPQPQQTSWRLQPSTWGTVLTWMGWLEACPSPVTLQTHHGTASPGQLQGVGCAPSPTPPSHPRSVYLPLLGQREARDNIGCHGDGGWVGNLGKQGPELTSQGWEAEVHVPSLVHASCSKRLPFKNRVKDYVIHNFKLATVE